MRQVICLLFFIFLPLSGCSRDASELTVVTGIGMDGHPGNYQVAAEVLQLNDAEQSNKSILLQMDGETLTEGIDRMVTLTGRALYCNHTQVLVVGRETAEAGLLPLLEELLQETQFPVSLRIAVAKDTAAEIMGTKPVVGDIHSVELEKILRESALENLSPEPQIIAFHEEITMPGKEAVLPFLELCQNNQEQVSRLMGSALFRGDRLLTVLKEEDSRCLMWMRGQAGGVLKSGPLMLEVTDLKCRIEAKPEGGVLHLELGIKAGEGETQKETLIQQAELCLQQRCEALLDTLRTLQCDAVGFGQRLYQTDPSKRQLVTEHWPEYFRSYPIAVEVTVKNITWGRIWTEHNGGEQDDS